MSTLFQGWRRKAGCMLLVVACVVTGWWIRSHHVCDTFSFPMLGKQHVIRMLAGRFCWSAGFPEGRYKWSLVSSARKEDDILELYSLPIFPMNYRPWMIPFRWPAIVLTMLSTYLIFWKPRKRGQSTVPPAPAQ